MASLDKWDDYTRAKEAMFLHCDTSDAPWTVIKSDCKKRARLNAMRYVLQPPALCQLQPGAHRARGPTDRRPAGPGLARGEDVLAATSAG